MVCERCGGEVTWRGPITALTHTECAACGARNSQKTVDEDEDEDEDEWGCDHCRNDGALTPLNTCPKCDAQFDTE